MHSQAQKTLYLMAYMLYLPACMSLLGKNGNGKNIEEWKQDT